MTRRRTEVRQRQAEAEPEARPCAEGRTEEAEGSPGGASAGACLLLPHASVPQCYC
jgi:hypothetical protein